MRSYFFLFVECENVRLMQILALGVCKCTGAAAVGDSKDLKISGESKFIFAMSYVLNLCRTPTEGPT